MATVPEVIAGSAELREVAGLEPGVEKSAAESPDRD